MEKYDLRELYENLAKKTGINDVGFHRIIDGRLYPVSKVSTKKLGQEEWKEEHGKNPVYLSNSILLTDIYSQKRTVYIYDIEKDERSPQEFFKFNIKSILIIPVSVDGLVAGIVVIASIGKHHIFEQNIIDDCNQIVDSFFQKRGVI